LSPATPPSFGYGSIVVVEGMLDPQGGNPKDRPCVVVTAPGDAPDGHQIVVAISTLLPDPLPDDYVELPWHRSGHPRTGLTKKNAAIGRWVAIVEDSRIIRTVGVVPDKRLLKLAEILDRLYPRADQP
jgi:PemK-like, MazF-like toxin of type II toxin-antitoxin system